MTEVEETSIDESYRLLDSTKYAAIGTLVGMIAVFLLVTLSLIFPEEASGMDSAQPIPKFIERAELYTSEITTLIILDTIFIAGYVSLFVGLWHIIRDFSEIMSRVALILGFMVGFFDIVENSLLIVLVNGLQTGWIPDERMYNLIFVLNIFIDLLSYLAALIYGIIFLAIFRPWNRKFFLGILLFAYVIIGLGSILSPSLILVRSLMFVIGLIVGGTILWFEEDIPTEVLEKLLQHQKESKNDFIR